MISSNTSSLIIVVPRVLIETLTGSLIPLAYAIPISHLVARFAATIFFAIYLA